MGVSKRTLRGNRFYATNTGRHPRLRHDLEETNVAGALHMRTTTQLGRKVAHAEHPHFVAVFLTKQGHRAGLDRIVVLHDFGLHRVIGADCAIDQRIDGVNLLVGHRLRM